VSEPLDREALVARTRLGYVLFNEEGEDRWLAEFTTSDFVWDMEPLGLGLCEGREAYRRFLRDWMSSYDTWSLELEQIEVPRPGLTVTAVVQRGSPRGTDQSVDFRWGQITLWEGDRIRRVINFETVGDARDAVAEWSGA
jgi:hypothetical protein